MLACTVLARGQAERVGSDYDAVLGYHNLPTDTRLEEEKQHLRDYQTGIRRFVGAFETAFHRDIPLERKIYGVPYEWYENYGVQRLSYHGASHSYIDDVLNAEKKSTARSPATWAAVPPSAVSSTAKAWIPVSA